MIRKSAATMAAALALHAAVAWAAGDEAGPVDLDALRWSELPNGVRIAVFMGDPKQPGPYGSRAKLPPDWRVAPHTHPEDGRVTTVVSGTLYWATGEVFDESKLRAFGPGSVILEPKGVAHYAMTKQDGAQIQTTSMGPAGMTFLDAGR